MGERRDQSVTDPHTAALALTLGELRAFSAVCQTGSMSRAADALGCSKSHISVQIAAVERALGVALFERGPAGVTPTEAGRFLRERAAPDVESVLVSLSYLVASRAPPDDDVGAGR